MRRGFGCVLTLAVVAVVLFHPLDARAEDTVRVGDLVAISNAGLYIAIEKGYRDDVGILHAVRRVELAALEIRVHPALGQRPFLVNGLMKESVQIEQALDLSFIK